jgi:hypothetical protein
MSYALRFLERLQNIVLFITYNFLQFIFLRLIEIKKTLL